MALPPFPSPLTSSSPSSHPPLNSTRKDHAHHAVIAAHGNYRNYYFHRTAAHPIPDARLDLLPAELFRDKRVLDLGCNAGKLTIECVTHFGARRAVGIDLDDVLIERAKEEWREARRNNFASAADDDVSFLCNDFMQEGYWNAFRRDYGTGTFDVILLLSITKWLHLQHGDAGLMLLFLSLFDLLPEGGMLVIEPQEWANYRRAVSKNKALRPVFKGLELRPNFENELTGVGFVLEKVIEREEGGFSRPLMLWRKPVNTSRLTT